MKTLLKTIKTLFSAFDKPKSKITEVIESNLLEKWWLNDDILKKPHNEISHS